MRALTAATDCFTSNLDADQWRNNPVGKRFAELADRFHRDNEDYGGDKYGETPFDGLCTRVFVRSECLRRRDHQGQLQQWAIRESWSDYPNGFPDPNGLISFCNLPVAGNFRIR